MTKTTSRKIKFRAWDKVEQKMVYEPILENIKHIPLNEWLECDDFELMQFTGLKDKSNPCKEVYEGDIINHYGILVGNQYENPDILKYETNFLIQGLGTKTWCTTYKKAVEFGCTDAE